MHPQPVATSANPSGPTRWRRVLLWGLLLLLLGVAQSLLLALTLSYESSRAQDETEAVLAEAAADIRSDLSRTLQTLQTLAWAQAEAAGWRTAAADTLKSRAIIKRIERRDAQGLVLEAVDTPYQPQLFVQMPRSALGLEADLACTAARRAAAPMYSGSYFVPLPGGLGLEVMDVCVPLPVAGRDAGFLVGSVALSPLLEGALAAHPARRHELSFVEGDGTRLARAGVPRGAGVFAAERVIDLPGARLQLRADSGAGRPSLVPNLTTALVLGLSLALFALVWLLARDGRRRAQAEAALAEALAFRQAMENSLITGLRARDLQGAIQYVNPAFCAMVGYSAEQLQQALSPELPPYWPPEHADEYQQRQQARMAGLGGAGGNTAHALREGFETVFMRQGGERFPVMIYEAPLVDGQGRHTGWMSTVLDVSAQRRMEDISRQQQDRLQATARLATVGEMASLLSHELNQPLAAITSYASGSLNLLDEPTPVDPSLLRQALERIDEQAQRAGRVIKSVHDFVRRREQHHETLSAALLIDAVLPLARLQARKSGTRIEVDLPAANAHDGPAAGLAHLSVRGDRTMLEQVLLNLTRNGIQAMETGTAPEDRVLTLRVRAGAPGWVNFSVIDAGTGISGDVAARLFTPFFTTRTEGMGLGLSLCRTVVEQHGGRLDFGPAVGPGGASVGSEFRFTLPTPKVRAADAAGGQRPHPRGAPAG